MKFWEVYAAISGVLSFAFLMLGIKEAWDGGFIMPMLMGFMAMICGIMVLQSAKKLEEAKYKEAVA